MQHSISLAVAVLSLVAGGPPDLVPTPVAAPVPADHRYPLIPGWATPKGFDIAARLTVMGGDGCICLNVRFTNLGPLASSAFFFQVTQQKFISAQRGYGAATALKSYGTFREAPGNPLEDGKVPALAATKYWQTIYYPSVESGSKYLFKITYSPSLIDMNSANHNIEITYTVP